MLGSGQCSGPIVAFVGEAPGETEDLTGIPFVGRAGMQLMRMIASMGLRREDVFLTNAVLCRPEENRTPTKPEMYACHPFLTTQLSAVAPRAIVCLGKVAAATLLQDGRAVEHLRGQWFAWDGIPVRVTYHPSFLIRPEGEGYRAHTWLDLQAVLTHLGLPIPSLEDARARVAAIPATGWEKFVEGRVLTEVERRAIAEKKHAALAQKEREELAQKEREALAKKRRSNYKSH